MENSAGEVASIESPSRRAERSRRAAIAASLAILWCLPILRIVLIGWVTPGANRFILDRSYYLATAIALLFFAGCIYALITMAEAIDRRRKPLASALVLTGLCFLIFRSLRKYELINIKYFADFFAGASYPVFVATALFLFAAVALLFVSHTRLVHRVTAVMLLALTPLAILLFAQVLWNAAASGPWQEWVEKPAARRQVSKQHVVLVIFDELDRRALGPNRLPGFKTPNWDRLDAIALVASAATAPTIATETAIPSILTGAHVASISRRYLGAQYVRFAGEQHSRPWSRTTNLFSRLEQMGINVGVVGWFHSYCSGLAEDVTRCWSAPSTLLPVRTAPLRRKTVEMLQGAMVLEKDFPARPAERNREILSHALKIVADTTLPFVYLHFSIPHYPALQGFAGNGYFGNLELVDATIGKLRSALEDAALWDRSTIIITGDHGATDRSINAVVPGRPEDVRSVDIPFLVKLPQQRDHVDYSRPFESTVLAQLVPAMLIDSVPDTKALTDRLAHARTVPHHLP